MWVCTAVCDWAGVALEDGRDTMKNGRGVSVSTLKKNGRGVGVFILRMYIRLCKV